ncbi:hypothetical protein [Streptomyces sp. SCSIO ZS0520]|uniref:hypothetical protein n=1 Tax=Streptomyces sp. SCSIO ZS0520 TaxID=2892996 RepID=UPI0021DAE21D|nr:hypothetical protein [Streptomyces sp. SCSIO ZS0520]
MDQEQRLKALGVEVQDVIMAVLPGASPVPFPSPNPEEILTLTAVDTDDPRSDAEMFTAVAAEVARRNWEIDEAETQESEASLFAVRAGLGAGFFSCAPATVGFAGFPEGSGLFSGAADSTEEG